MCVCVCVCVRVCVFSRFRILALGDVGSVTVEAKDRDFLLVEFQHHKL